MLGNSRPIPNCFKNDPLRRSHPPADPSTYVIRWAKPAPATVAPKSPNVVSTARRTVR